MKVVYNQDTKKLVDQDSYLDLIKAVKKAFNLSDSLKFGQTVKFYYMDDELDIISIDSQDDLDQARAE